MIFTLNTDNQAKEILEGQRRYREQMASQYTAGFTDCEEKLNPIIKQKEEALAEKDNVIAEKNNTIAKMKAHNAEMEAQIAQLTAELSKSKNNK